MATYPPNTWEWGPLPYATPQTTSLQYPATVCGSMPTSRHRNTPEDHVVEYDVAHLQPNKSPKRVEYATPSRTFPGPGHVSVHSETRNLQPSYLYHPIVFENMGPIASSSVQPRMPNPQFFPQPLPPPSYTVQVPRAPIQPPHGLPTTSSTNPRFLDPTEAWNTYYGNSQFVDHFPPIYRPPSNPNPWVPQQYLTMNPLEQQRIYIPHVHTNPAPVSTKPVPAHLVSQFADPMSSHDEEPAKHLEDEEVNEEIGRNDHSAASYLSGSETPPMGFLSHKVIIGEEKQRVVRNPARLSDVRDYFANRICPICGDEYHNETTSNVTFRKHLLNHHLNIVARSFVPHLSQREFQHDLLAWAESSHFSPERFEDPTFAALVLKYTAFEPPSADAVSDAFFRLFERSQIAIETYLTAGDVMQVFLTVDEWTSASADSFLGILVAILDRETKMQTSTSTRVVKRRILRRRLIGFEYLHDGRGSADLLHSINATLARYKLANENIIGIISDNAAGMSALTKLAIRLRVPCIAHLLQLAITTLWTPRTQPPVRVSSWTFNKPRYYSIQIIIFNCLRRIRKLFKWIRASAKLSQQLALNATLADAGLPHKVHLDVITRWDSTRQLLNCYWALQTLLQPLWQEYATEKGFGECPLFSPNEFKLVAVLHSLLQHISRVQESLCEDAPTIPRLLPTMYRLATELNKNQASWHNFAGKDFNSDFNIHLGEFKSAHKRHKMETVDQLVPDTHILHSSREASSGMLLSMLSHILMGALNFYWPFFDLSQTLNHVGPIAKADEDELCSQNRGLVHLYTLGALSDPLNLKLDWVDPEMLWFLEHDETKRNKKVEVNKKLMRDLYKKEHDRVEREEKAPKSKQYLGFVSRGTPVARPEDERLDDWWFNGPNLDHPAAFRIAKVALLADASSCEIERVNSRAALINEKHRQSMDPKKLGQHVMLTYNAKRMQIEEERYELLHH